MADGLRVQLKGAWSAAVRGLDQRKFEERLRRQLVVAHRRIGRQFVANARRAIRARNYADNSPITVILKASSTPLVDTGQLFQAITFTAPDPFTLRLGVHKERLEDGHALDIAVILHEGATIVVTPEIRAAVFAKLGDQLHLIAGKYANQAFNKAQRKTIAGAIEDLGGRGPRGAGRSVWRIPGRPYLAEPLNDPAFVTFVRQTWSDAVRIALTPPG